MMSIENPGLAKIAREIKEMNNGWGMGYGYGWIIGLVVLVVVIWLVFKVLKQNKK